MKLQNDDKYFQKKYSFPNENVDQEDKNDPEYFLKCANAIVWKFTNNKTFLPYAYAADQDSIPVLRSYLRGSNSPDKYKNRFATIDKKGKRTTTMNISWRVPQILPEKMDVVRGYLMKLAYDVSTKAIDMQAQIDKDTVVANMKLMVDDRIKAIGPELNAMAGREIVAPEEEPMPFKNEQQVEIFSQIGGVLLEQEASIKILLDNSMMQSDWEGIAQKLAEDVLALAICGTVVYNEVDSEVNKVRWVDMERAILPWSDYNDFRDITWGGEIMQITVAELRKQSKLEETQILEIARMYSRDDKSQQYIGGFYSEAQRGYSDLGFGMNMIDSLVLDVADVKWVGHCTDTHTKVKRKKGGNIALNRVGDTYELSKADEKDGKEIMKHTRQCVYKAKLIVGTDYVFDYGKEFNQTYTKDDRGNMKVIFPYSFSKTGSSSLVSRCIGFVDDLALATYKKRNAIKKLPPPPGVYIEKSAFANIEIGGNKMNPITSMKLFQDEGYLIGDQQNLWGNATTNRQPITEIPFGIISQLTLFNAEIEFNTVQIERVTGINDIFSGSTPQNDTGLGVSKLAIDATMNAIFPVVRTIENVEKRSLNVSAQKWQVTSLDMDRKGRKPMPYDRALRYIKLGNGKSFNDFMIEIKPGATQQDKMMLLQEIRALQDVRRQSGVGGIRPSDYVLIYKMIMAGQIDQARLVLAQVEEYIEQLDQKKAMDNQKFTFESQMASNQQTADNEKDLLATEGQIESQSKAQEIQLQLQADIIKQRQKAEDERRTIAISNVYGWGADNYNSRKGA